MTTELTKEETKLTLFVDSETSDNTNRMHEPQWNLCIETLYDGKPDFGNRTPPPLSPLHLVENEQTVLSFSLV